MLLNASHKLTHSGLAKTPDLHDVYVRYKRNTRGVLTWFQKHGPTPNKTIKSLTIISFEVLVQDVSQKLSSLPDIVFFYLRGAIADRKRLNKYYRNYVDNKVDDADSVGHEHFTARLEKIFTDLCGRFGGPTSQLRKKQVASAQKSQPDRLNQFEGLKVEEVRDVEEQDDGEFEYPLEHLMADSAQSSISDEDLDIHLADDGLGMAIERIQNISSSIDGYWGAAGKGTISFVVASVMTNVAFALLRQVVTGLLQHDESLSCSELVRICSSFRGSFETELRSQKIVGKSASLINRLQDIEQTILDCRDDAEFHLHGISCTKCGQRFANEVHSRVINGTASSRVVSIAMTENMAHWASSSFVPCNMILGSTPVCSAVAEEFDADTKDDLGSWSAILGLHLMTQGYRAHLRYIKKPALVPKSRIIALKLAQQVHSQVSRLLEDRACFPCQCAKTLGWHMGRMAFDLNLYAKHNCWDLISQTPWVAGNHVLEILSHCSYYGYYLLKYRNYAGAVLHCYNALVQFGGLEKIHLLDMISKQLLEPLFPGGQLPTSNFHACWARYVGARLKFSKNHKGKNTHETWCLSVPAHAAKVNAGIGIPGHGHNAKMGCLLFHIKEQNYHVSDAQWALVNDSFAKLQKMTKGSGSKKGPEETAQKSSAQVEKQRLLPLAVSVQAMFVCPPGTTLPMARVNLFELFERCVRVVSGLSAIYHPTEHEQKQDHCVCFTNEILSGADRLVKGRRHGQARAWTEIERTFVKDTKEAIVAAFGKMKESDILWEV